MEGQKFPCILGQKGTTLTAEKCTISGGNPKYDAKTTGVLLSKPKDVTLKSCIIGHHLEGGVILDLDSESTVNLEGNELRICETAAIYIQGEDSCPNIEKNLIKLCLSPGIKIGMGVNANLYNNTLKSNTFGIIVIDSKSKLFQNKIEKCHENGIEVICSGNGKICNPDIEENEVVGSKFHGILVRGDSSHPKIIGNKVENNKK